MPDGSFSASSKRGDAEDVKVNCHPDPPGTSQHSASQNAPQPLGRSPERKRQLHSFEAAVARYWAFFRTLSGTGYAHLGIDVHEKVALLHAVQRAVEEKGFPEPEARTPAVLEDVAVSQRKVRVDVRGHEELHAVHLSVRKGERER